MPTSLQLGSRALRLIGALASGQSLPAEETSDMLEALNAMMDAWRIERLMVYQIVQGAYSWTGGNASRTIGSGGNFNATRPDRIDSAFIRDSNSQDYPMTILEDRTQYDSFVAKSTQSAFPEYLFYDPAYPLGTLYVYPVPSATVTLLLNTWQVLQTFADTATSLSLPPGYEDAIVHNLAARLAPEYPHDPAKLALVMPMARQLKAAIKSINMPSMVAQMDPGVVGARRGYNIYTDR